MLARPIYFALLLAGGETRVLLSNPPLAMRSNSAAGMCRRYTVRNGPLPLCRPKYTLVVDGGATML